MFLFGVWRPARGAGSPLFSDLGKAFDFGVTWDGAANTIRIDTAIGYSE